MQRIIKTNDYIHPIMEEVDAFYSDTSTFEPRKKTLFDRVYDTSFTMLANTFLTYSSLPSSNVPNTFTDKGYQPLDLPKYDENNIIVCFSGGKDSLALVLKCLDKGYNVHLYAVKHINQSYVDEIEQAQKIADYLHLPIYVDDIRLGGKHDWMEHPMKNMIIANSALSYGIREGIGTRVFFGNYTTSSLENEDFVRCAGDCMDMWDSYNYIINRIIPGFKIEADLKDMGETLEIVTPKRDLLDLSLSCLCRHSLREYRHNWVKEKFGIELPNNRCGSCYKCLVEYIYMADHDLIEFSRDYYRYCINALYHVYLDTVGATLDINNIWYSFMSYDIHESKIVNDLEHARLFIKNIKWEDSTIVQKDK